MLHVISSLQKKMLKPKQLLLSMVFQMAMFSLQVRDELFWKIKSCELTIFYPVDQ